MHVPEAWGLPRTRLHFVDTGKLTLHGPTISVHGKHEDDRGTFHVTLRGLSSHKQTAFTIAECLRTNCPFPATLQKMKRSLCSKP